MSEWLNSWTWTGAFMIVGASAIYGTLRPVRDYYVLQRQYFVLLDEAPWRGKEEAAYYHAFVDYLAAKAAFDQIEETTSEEISQEIDNRMFMVPARSKSGAIARLKSGKARDKELLHRTPGSIFYRRREHWWKAAKEDAAFKAYITEQPDH